MLKGAIVGFGEVARHGHWPAWAASRDAEIVAVVDRTAERRALAGSLVPGLVTFATLDELSQSTAIDFIDICTPPALHPEPMLEAIARGWHVLCEKPFLLDAATVEIVRARAAAAGVAVVPVQNWKYAPAVERATGMLRAGLIGRLQRVEIETMRIGAALTADTERVNWRRDPAVAGGGILMDHGWHAVYLALQWFERSPATVHATLHRPPEGGVEDEASLAIVFPNGSAAIRLTWNSDVRRNRLHLTGELGELSIEDDTLRVTGHFPCCVRFSQPLSAGSHHDDWFAAMLGDVVACFRDPARSTHLLDEAAACLSVIQRAYESDLSLSAPAG
jgi:predicted dehydrogenase